jgi:transposase-like protein
MAKYSDETKAAVMSALLTGQSVSSVAREYNIPKGTVSEWKNHPSVGQNPTQKTEIADLLLAYLRTNLEALQVQAEHFKDKTWLSRQSAESAAVLHGVMTDKAIRLLEALSKANAEPGDNAP